MAASCISTNFLKTVFSCLCVECVQSDNSDKLSKFVNAINGNEGTGYV